MKRISIFTIALSATLLATCSPSKKTTSTTVTSTPVVAPTEPAKPATVTGPSLPAKSTDGIYVPGKEEVDALLPKYADANLQTLRDGYTLYVGKCTNCHGAFSIYSRSEEKWPAIIDDMAQKAQLTSTQKDAVYKYVFAIKATQPK